MPSPSAPDPPPPPEMPPPPPDEPGSPYPSWRTLRNTSRFRKPRPDQPRPPEPHLIVPDEGSPGLFGPRTPRPPELGPAPTGEPVHSWVTWHPNPALAPTPPPIEPRLILSDDGSPGLFGPRTPQPPELGPAPTGELVHSWVTWHPNPALAPTPPLIEPHLLVSDDGSPGLFGPRSPRPPELDPAPMGEPVHSWVTWHPNPARASTPSSIESNLIVPDDGSPGLFGPRSPRSYR